MLRLESLEFRELLAADVVMFNDHVSGNGTHPFTTSYAANGVTSGQLLDSQTGQGTGITLTTSAAGVAYESTAGQPAVGTEAYAIFNGWVDFGSGFGASLALSGNDTYTLDFSGLDSGKAYEFAGSAVRGNAGYTNRWTLVTLVGADGFTPAHSSGVGIVTDGLAANQVAVWTGENHQANQGFVAQWLDIDPGVDGQFQVISEQYRGATPGVGSGSAAFGSKGYALTGIRLTELDASFRVASSDPPNGSAVTVAPTEYTVHFNSPVNPSTLQAADLKIDGLAATSYQILDADSVRFTIPKVTSNGFHTVTIAAGAISSTGEGLPLEAFNGTFAILEATGVVINEIHYDSGDDGQPLEYIELFNGGPDAISLSGWYFEGGISFSFPAGTAIDSGQYLLVAQNPSYLQGNMGVTALGPYGGRLSNTADVITLRDATGVKRDEVDYQLGYPWPTVGDVAGHSIQLLNPSFENSVGGNWRSALATPAASNSVFTINAPPATRQVSHSPKSPVSGQDVTVTVKATDPDGVAHMTLLVQTVEPGDYIEIGDPRYQTQWTSIAMHDDGINGDVEADDDVFTAIIPASTQLHRRLIRYRINAEDSLGASVRVPYQDDPQPNFAYFVYDGVPEWNGAVQPGVTPDVTYGTDLLSSVSTYHLITTRQDHVDAQFIPGTTRNNGYGGDDYLWQGALVFDGVVYDHIRYRARGGVWRYSMGKNMWKFDFNRGHGFEARDDYGNKYTVDWDKLNLSAIIQQGDYWHRGEQGLFEAVGFKLFNLAGVESSKTNYVQFRIVEGADENGSDQYSSDFQGLYLAVEQLDDQFLEEHNLPDGNLYKMEGGTGVGGIGGVSNNQGDYPQPSDSSDLIQFKSTYESGTQSAAWWEDNLDLDSYYSYRSILEAIHHYDTGFGKNYFYYHNPETDKWETIPWDLDLTWANNMFGNGAEPFRDRVLAISQFATDYRNRMREIRDLLYNSEQAGMLIDEIANFVYTAGQPSLVDADRAMWDNNPIMTSNYVNSSKAGAGRFYAGGGGIPPTGSFAGMIQLLKNYVVSRGSYIDNVILNDEGSIPSTPTVSYLGQIGYPANDLRFRTTQFLGNGGSFAGMEWRIAEITDTTARDFDPDVPRNYEINATWESGELTTFDSEIVIPGAQIEAGKDYRVRVRMKDSNGRWSHWSNPLQFTATSAVGEATSDLRITEVNYHPHDALTSFGELGTEADDFEFIELTNVGVAEVDLTGIRFATVDVNGSSEGFDFTFPSSTLSPGQSIVVVEDLAAFQSRYGTTVLVAGQWSGGLSNSGERVTLLDADGRTIQSFDYNDSGSWPGRPDGLGSTLEVISTSGDYNSAANWRASDHFGGTPGTANSTIARHVVINEILSHSEGELPDVVELFNSSSQTVNISNWYLSDDLGNPLKYQFPANTTLAAGQYLVLEQGEFGFGLDGQFGDQLLLLAADNATGKPSYFADEQDFDATELNLTIGRWPNGSTTGILYPLAEPTMGGANASPSISNVVISEVHYHAAPVPPAQIGQITEQELGFLEITNTSQSAIDVGNWEVNGFGFVVPSGTMLAAGQSLVVVPFNPVTEPSKAQAFRDVYGVNASVNLIGPAGGQLNNAGERIKLLRPLDSNTLLLGMVMVDTVAYDEAAPWPSQADGQGSSLQRTTATAFGDLASSWLAATPTPGTTSFVTQQADFDANGVVDGRDFLIWQKNFGLQPPNGTPSLGDADGDQDVDGDDLEIWSSSLPSQNQTVNVSAVNSRAVVNTSSSAAREATQPRRSLRVAGSQAEPGATLSTSGIDAIMAQIMKPRNSRAIV